ncbi:MAG: acyclic terpene utilization AtuA family protein [Betaproteobacteria bacterium]
MKLDPHVIIGQGTSTDPGPYYLGQDDIYGYVGKENKKRDIGLLIGAARKADIPFVFSGGSPSGSDAQLEGILRIMHEIAVERGLRLRAAVISGEIDKEWLKRKLRSGARTRRIIDTPRLPEVLTEEAVDDCKRIVAQMGPEPIMAALRMNTQGVVAGRSLDIGLYMAYPMLYGFDKGLTAHMAKTIECGALCASPPINENVFAHLRRDHFLVHTLGGTRKCTTASVAAHAFYERQDIAREENPGGYLDITTASYTQHDERTVRVAGARWVDLPYTIKLEGAKKIGYRTITIAGLRDPHLVKNIDGFLERSKAKALEKFGGTEFSVTFHQYGKNAVLGKVDPLQHVVGHEIGLVIAVVAPTQEQATSICAFVRGQLHFGDFPGRTSTAGNIATLFSPAEIPMGEAFIWNVWHALELDDPCEPFPARIMEFPNPEWI